jgi:hypothetical protein
MASYYNEWELFCIETGIEPGDTVIVTSSGGKTVRMVYVADHESMTGRKTDNTVELCDSTGKRFFFVTDTLCGITVPGMTISDVSSEPLIVKKKNRRGRRQKIS